MAIVVEVITSESTGLSTTGPAKVIEVVRGTTSPIETVNAQSAVEVVKPGGTVVNAQWGYEFPADPHEGQIFIKVTQ